MFAAGFFTGMAALPIVAAVLVAVWAALYHDPEDWP